MEEAEPFDSTGGTGGDAVETLAAEYVAEAASGTKPVMERYLARLSSDPDRTRFRQMIDDVDTVDGLLPRQVREGVLLAGRYRIGRELGRGGMGKVFEARDEKLGRDVAVKVLATIDAPGFDLEELFAHEVATLARLSHPNIVAIHESGKDADVSFLVMDRVRGTSLSHVIESVRRDADGAPPKDGAALYRALEHAPEPGARRVGDESSWFRTAAAIVAELARTLEAAHAAGVIHRDLKPSNVLLRGDAMPVVLDFGLAGVRERESGLLTGALFGTSWYLAPEQVTARRAGKDPRTDVYQLGLVLYELLTLERAFHADEVTELLKKIVDGDFVRPRARCTEIPPELEDVCLKAMELDPSARYQSALELREDLERFATGSAAPLAGSRGVMVRAARNARYFARRRKGMLAAAALVLLGGAIGALLLRDTNDPHGPIRAFIANADDSDARFVRDEGVVHPGETICIDMDGVEAGWLYAVNVFYPPSGAEPLVRPIREREFDGNPQRISLVSVEDGTPAGQREGFVVFRSRERSPSLFEWITLMELENRPITLAEANASLGRRLNATTRGGSEGMRPSAVREVREEAPKDALFPAIAHLEVFRTFLRVER